MIDDKKIEETARYYCNNRYPASQDAPFIAEGFRHGAKWMQEEFLKGLWHPNTEEPKAGKKILAYTIDGYETITYIGEGEIDSGTNWMDIVSDMAIASWCYPEDLLPKKGGKQ